MAVKQSFELLQRNLLTIGGGTTPHVLIITASDQYQDLTKEIDLVREKMMAVDILTLATANNAKLLSLAAPFGHLFAGKPTLIMTLIT